MPTRTARTAWNGTLQEGSGQVELSQLQGRHLRRVLPQARGRGRRRHHQPRGAHRRGALGLLRHAALGRHRRGRRHAAVPRRQADVSLGPDPAGGFRLTGIKITVRGEVDGLDAAGFVAAAEAAKAGCPVSKALTGVEITLDAGLE